MKITSVAFAVIVWCALTTGIAAQSFFWISPYSARLGKAYYGYIGNCIDDHFNVGGLSYAAYGSSYNAENQQWTDANIPLIYKITPTRTVTTFGAIGTKVEYGGTEVQNATADQMNTWIAQLNTMVDSIVKTPALNSKIIAWYIMPEECRQWVANELTLTTAAYNAVKKYDPQNRPAFMYFPQHSDYGRFQSFKDIMDIYSVGIYPHNSGNTHNRYQVRNAMEQMKKANNTLVSYYKQPAKPMVPVLEMWEDNTATYSAADAALVPRFVQHDVYAAIANGAKGILIWSMGSRTGFNTYAPYYTAWAKFSNDTYKLGLRDVFFSGKDTSRVTFKVNSGEATHLFTWNTFSNTFPSLSLREIDYNGKNYILVVNSSEGTVGFTLSHINVASGTVYEDLMDSTLYTIQDSTLTDSLPAYGVLLLTTALNTAVDNKDTKITRSNYSLFQNYPNPFNPTTRISYYVPAESQVSLEVYNSLGMKVSTLYEGFRAQGNYSTMWNGKDDAGASLASGIYFYTLHANNMSITKKMILVK